jgi:hypothetical protein
MRFQKQDMFMLFCAVMKPPIESDLAENEPDAADRSSNFSVSIRDT